MFPARHCARGLIDDDNDGDCDDSRNNLMGYL